MPSDPTLLDEVELLLVYMSASKPKRESRIPLSRFGSPVPFFPGAIEGALPPDERLFLPPSDFVPDSIGPFDFSTVSYSSDEGAYSVRRTRTINLREVRGRVRRIYPQMVEVLAGRIETGDRREWWGGRGWFGWNGQRWAEVQRTDREPVPLPTSHREGETIQMMQSAAFSSQWWWMASIGWVGLPSITLPTDAVGARAIFRLRDLPEGRKRRAAIRHWVAEHWRKRRKDPTEETNVRAHLRGETRFTWNGLSVRLRPSRIDLERADAIREQAAKAPRKRKQEAN